MNNRFNFWVNSLGEYGRYTPQGEQYGGGWVNVVEAEREGLTVEQAFERDMREFCSATELALLKEIEALRFPDSARWRIGGGIDYNTLTKHVSMSTEFSHDRDDADFWRRLEAIVALHGGEMEEMWEDEQRGYWQSPPDDLDVRDPAARQHPSYVPAENEGVVNKQVAVSWDVHGKTRDEATSIREKFDAATQAIWEQAGVGVL